MHRPAEKHEIDKRQQGAAPVSAQTCIRFSPIS